MQVPVAANTTAGSPAGTAFVHYWLVENAARRADAPTVVWQQGGPGGSSLIGLFTEMGPVTLNDASFRTAAYNATGIPTVFDNPHGWHTAPANVLFVEHPAPTGFSYCIPHEACDWDDFRQAVVSYDFYVRFFEEYPELAANDFYFSGESYAGVLVPTVALQILGHRSETNRHLAPWSLRGFALGNDCPGNQVYTCTPYSGWRGVKVAVDFRYGHGMVPEPLYKEIYAECGSWWGDDPYPANPGMDEEPPAPCRRLLEDPVRPCMSVTGDTYSMGGGYFLYDTCSQDMLALSPGDHLPHPERVSLPADPAPETAGAYPCGQERASTLYLNLPEVQRAAHVELVGKPRFDFHTSLQYNFSAFSLLEAYKEKLAPSLHILQYSGDADPCVPHVGTQRWIESLGLPVLEPWRPWAPPGGGPPAGYKVRYDAGGPEGASSFTYATLRDAGHMAPRYKPREALHMIRQFLRGTSSAAEVFM